MTALFDAHPGGDGVGFNQKRTFRNKGWGGLAREDAADVRVLSDLYARDRHHRGGILLKVTCHDFNGDAITTPSSDLTPTSTDLQRRDRHPAPKWDLEEGARRRARSSPKSNGLTR
jgi:hypothetical protein